MFNPIVVVESPTKVKTVKKYLGEKYKVVATVGHIKDLPSNEIGVNIEKDFEPSYTVIQKKSSIIKKIKKSAINSTDVYLAPDPDREGEAIAWHIAEILKKKGRRFHRVLFYELTKKAIKDAILNPKSLDKNKYEAQKTRRILDRLVGYEISSLLWSKVKRGLSAGRVQSVSVRIICEREMNLRNFKSYEYWSVFVNFREDSIAGFVSKFLGIEGKKTKFLNRKKVVSIIKKIRFGSFLVDNIIEKIRKKNPKAPFTTSQLQQKSIKNLGFSAKKTMQIAQQLYEGVDVNPGQPIGLITYMRTDSVRVSKEAANETRIFITDVFGDKYAMKKFRVFKNKKKAQDAHEAIRPTSVLNTPEKVSEYLSNDQFRLYSIIWKRFVASQMQSSLIYHKTVTIKSGKYIFRSWGSSVKFDGFMVLNKILKNSGQKFKNIENLPEFFEGQELKLNRTILKQHFKQPPPRFSEATLVKELEENGIGRPSTYAVILSNMRSKGYVSFNKKHFIPTELGFIVNELLVESFPDILDVEFTAKMEDELDNVEQGNINGSTVLAKFYENFSMKMNKAKKEMLSVKINGILTNLICPKCKKNFLKIRIGKNGHFISCSKYPDCTFSSDYERNNVGKIVLSTIFNFDPMDKLCPLCKNEMVIKVGKYGKFLACTGYPECTYTRSININNNLNIDIGIKCPEDNCLGNIVERRSKRGKIFYSCNCYPKCKFATWYRPVDILCPKCNSMFLLEKKKKQNKIKLFCPSEKCGFEK